MTEGLFQEAPEPTDKHVLNYLKLLGAVLRDYRKTHPQLSYRSTESFKRLAIDKYYQKPIDRKTIRSAEQGKVSVSVGVYSAILQEMDVWPEIIDAITSGKAEDVRYVEIVINELRRKEKENQKLKMKTLHQKFFKEIV